MTPVSFVCLFGPSRSSTQKVGLVSQGRGELDPKKTAYQEISQGQDTIQVSAPCCGFHCCFGGGDRAGGRVPESSRETDRGDNWGN